ncbi:MAG: aldehyde dehydrogenase [Nocardioidaceae bacterium]|jgi:aldehyde dehydrogenase (NAD+)|nr:aldehyde dehydrogenase [Nocardioidaceae bacterium]
MNELALITDGYLDGAVSPLSTDQRWDSINPSTGEVLARVAVGTADDVDHAVGVAGAAYPAWRFTRPSDRGRILNRVALTLRQEAQEFARVESLDTGKPFSIALGDVEVAARYFEFYAGAADKLHGDVIPLGAQYHAYTTHEPYGVIGVILPWNAPLQQAARSIAPALATGNVVVAKPAEDAPLSVLLLAALASRCGLPAGVLNVVPGDGPGTGQALVDHPCVRRLMFTGSVEVGRHVGVAGAERLVPVGLELGGKSPNIVFADADLEAAAKGSTLAITYNSGQACSAGSRLLVQEEIYDEFLALMADRLGAVSVGHALDDPDIGPITTRDQFARVQDYLSRAEANGATAVLDARAEVLDRHPGGLYVAPKLLAAQHGSLLSTEEIFGPVLVATRFSDVDEAIALANDTEYGLVSGLWTRDVNLAHYVAPQLQSGQVFVNNWFGGGVETPFGGYKNSGIGREKGFEALHHYTQVKTTIFDVSIGS